MNLPFEPIQKPCIFITSGGRTGTFFLSKLLAVAVHDCHSVQEPDVLRVDQPLISFNDRENWYQKARDFGFFSMVFGKFTTLGSARGLSLARQTNKIDAVSAAARLHHLRNRYICRLEKSVFAECNLQLAGLIDIIPLVFPNSKTVFMIRDGRNWVRSWLNLSNTPYGKKDPLYYLLSGRPKAQMIPDDPFRNQWERFSQFQRTCWAWRFHIEYAIKSIKANPHAKLVKYEDLFEGAHQKESINNLLKYVTVFPDGYQAEYRYNGELSGKKFHESRLNQLPKWENWSPDQVREFQEVCGDFLIQQGYGKEPQWQEMTAKAT